jgi:hypothetical protein
MSELEARLERILPDHQQESGLNMIGGRRQLVARLLAFCEEILQEAATHEDSTETQRPAAGAA